MMTSQDILQAASAQLQSSVVTAGVQRDGLGLSDALLSCAAVGPKQHYKHMPQAVHALVARARQRLGETGTGAALHLAIVQALHDTLASGRLAALPPRVQAHQLRQFQRIVQTCRPDAEWLTLDNDLCHKDFGLATLRLYAGAAQLIDPRCGIARSILMADGLGGMAQATAAIARLGGFSPYFQIHTHTAYLDEFNEEGWNECYRTCADLYALHPQCLGMYGGSWFYDPALAEISPRLTYLAQVPLQAGAERLLLARQGEFVDDAIATSPTRRKLHEEGKYKPCSYLLAWGRHAQVQWAQANPGRAGA